MILVNNPGDGRYVYWPLEHAAWNGWTPTDLIFPFFLWISGFSLALVGGQKSIFSIFKRAGILIGLGLLLNAFPFGMLDLHHFQFNTWRFPGVLQRIGFCYLVSALIYSWGRSKLTLFSVAFFALAYIGLTELLPVPGYGARNLSLEGSVERWIDGIVFGGHTWAGSPFPGFDPEGLVSSLSSTMTMQLGVLSYSLLNHWINLKIKSSGLIAFGVLSVLLGLVLDSVWPINKGLWSVSYVLLTNGWAVLFFLFLYYVYDYKNFVSFSKWPEAFGSNALLAFLLTSVVAKILKCFPVADLSGRVVSLKEYSFSMFLLLWIQDPYFASLVFSVLYILIFTPAFIWLKSHRVVVRI